MEEKGDIIALWVIERFVNLRWFQGKFQLKIRWEEQMEEQDDWRDYQRIMEESAAWRRELAMGEEELEDPIIPLVEDYYQFHPHAP